MSGNEAVLPKPRGVEGKDQMPMRNGHLTPTWGPAGDRRGSQGGGGRPELLSAALTPLLADATVVASGMRRGSQEHVEAPPGGCARTQRGSAHLALCPPRPRSHQLRPAGRPRTEQPLQELAPHLGEEKRTAGHLSPQPPGGATGKLSAGSAERECEPRPGQSLQTRGPT